MIYFVLELNALRSGLYRTLNILLHYTKKMLTASHIGAYNNTALTLRRQFEIDFFKMTYASLLGSMPYPVYFVTDCAAFSKTASFPLYSTG